MFPEVTLQRLRATFLSRESLWTLVWGGCIIKPRKEHIMDITILGFRIRVYKDPKVPKQVYLYITSRDGNTFYVLIQDMGKNVK